MKPFRRKQNCQVTTDPLTGLDRILAFSREEDVLSDEGSIDSTGVERKVFLDCGCDGETGGRCYECGAISCRACHGHCANCHKPICMEHSRFADGGNGESIRLCRNCYDVLSRKQVRAKVRRAVLSLFLKRKEASND
jgi:hypothetical protein